MKTKIIALLLVLIMAVTMFAACVTTPEDPETETCTKHVDKNKDGKCDNEGCGADVPIKGDDEDEKVYPDVTWDETSLLFQMSDDDNGDQLSSSCRNYLAGGEDRQAGVSGAIYDSVDERNAAAEEYANVKVRYVFYEDGSHGWGKTINIMADTVDEPDETRPDMFCNFVYDMVSASLKGAFANVYSHKLDSGLEDGQLQNYFEFSSPTDLEGFDGMYNKDCVDDEENGGYMVEYMQSLTLSNKKMYLVASDYFIDLIRAYFVVPVNNTLLNNITPSDVEGSYNYDYYEDGVYDIYDFHDLVYDHKWNYETLKDFSQAVGTLHNDKNVLDENNVWGFALASGGLGASGILYTTSITVIQKTTNPDAVLGFDQQGNEILGEEYEYEYPDNFDVLKTYVGNLYDLFTSSGVTNVRVSAEDGRPVNATVKANTSAEEAVRDFFVANKVLFGGIICLGSIENAAYQSMTEDGGLGFGVAPVPLYRVSYSETNEDGTVTEGLVDDYLTSIHNIGRVGSISSKCKKFAQCSAFLNYQSLESKEILENYYEDTLKGAAAGAETNEEMLDYIRDRIRSAFDKTFEDAVARHQLSGGDSELNEEKWHNMLLANDYKMTVDQMNSKYEGVVAKKIKAFFELDDYYTSLP